MNKSIRLIQQELVLKFDDFPQPIHENDPPAAFYFEKAGKLPDFIRY